MEAPTIVRLPSALLKEVYEHASSSYPKESCGIFVGRREEGAWRAELFVPAQNVGGSHDRLVVDPKDRLRAEAQAKNRQAEVIGFYHSHPDQPVHFSKADLESSEEVLLGEPWVEPAYAYLVVAVDQGKASGHGAFRVFNGKSEPIEVLQF